MSSATPSGTSKTIPTSSAALDAAGSSAPTASSGSLTTTLSSNTTTFEFVSLFSGIGLLDLGLDRAGMTCVAQCERVPFRRTVLRRHWPEVAIHDDVRTFSRWWRGRGAVPVRAVVGGPPCQPHSHSGLGLGVADDRWQWPHFADVLDATGAPWAIIENVRGLLRDREALGWILADLADRGFDAEWSLVSACSVGAPHMRRRLFIVAYSATRGRGRRSLAEAWEQAGREEPSRGGGWELEPDVGRVANGGAQRVDRVSALGDAVVPRVADLVGRRVLAADRILHNP